MKNRLCAQVARAFVRPGLSLAWSGNLLFFTCLRPVWMQTILILVVGLSIVIGGILIFRLHAFVALILAGLTVAMLTPADLVVRSAQLESRANKVVIDRDGMLVLAMEPFANWQDQMIAADDASGQPLVGVGSLIDQVPLEQWQRPIPGANERSGDELTSNPTCYQFELSVDASEADALYVVDRSAFMAADAAGKQPFMKRLTTALGSYCGQLAILIVAASIIGRCLLDSGAADRIVRSALETVGEKNAPAAFVASGFTLSIPVFFDTVFYLMIPLGKALRLRTGGNYLLYVLAIVAGGTMAHSLVPPTPGPLFIAEAFNVSLLAMIIGGCIVGLISSSVAMLYAVWANRRFELQLPEADLQSETEAAEAVENSNLPAPGLLTSLTPIVLPVLMITMGALVGQDPDDPSQWKVAGVSVSQSVADAFRLAGDKNFALLVSAIFAVLMYVKVRRPCKETFSRTLQDAVSSAGTIILVTAAGGAFGRMMRQTSVAELLEGLPGTSPVMVVVAAFLVTTAVRTAQGSSTVAMITAAGIFGGLVSSGAAGVSPLYVALAVGCGSKPIAWMNDSGFWVITRMSGMTEKEGLKYITPMTALAGVAGLCVVVLGVLLFP